jgi:peptidoglycan/xylan/chitin deacetylase (PgdA/CDA1 family)
MLRLARGALVLAISLTAGSWLGLGRPDPSRAREVVATAKQEVVARATGASPAGASPAPSAAPRPAEEDKAIGLGQPRAADPSAVPALRPWPELNPDASIERGWIVAEGPRHEPGDTHRLVTLTFDDGPFLETTPTILKLLAAYKLRATFFVVGRYLDGDTRRDEATRRLLKKIDAAGHLIGNHTHDHSRLTIASHTRVLEQIDEGSASIERVTGKKPLLFRPPFGELDDFGRAAVRERGLDVLLWNIEVNDMQRDDPHEMLKDITRQLNHKEGGIVLLHDIRKTSVAVVRELLVWLNEHRWDPKKPSRVGYEVVDLPTYLRAVAAAPQPYETREDLEKARDARRRAGR